MTAPYGVATEHGLPPGRGRAYVSTRRQPGGSLPGLAYGIHLASPPILVSGLRPRLARAA